MGERVTFACNGDSCPGYLSSGGGPGVLVIQEWWGLVPHIVDVVERFAAAGFTALAPDLYHGESSTEPDAAGKLMMSMNIERAARDLSGALDLLVEQTNTPRIGVVGYCMGGALALVVAAQRRDVVRAVAPYYGALPWRDVEPDWSRLDAKVVGEYAELDGSFPPERVAGLEAQLRSLGKDVTLHVHEDAHHAFFNDARPEVYAVEPALEAWERTLALFREELVASR